jgi:hypothetical protein
MLSLPSAGVHTHGSSLPQESYATGPTRFNLITVRRNYTVRLLISCAITAIALSKNVALVSHT